MSRDTSNLLTGRDRVRSAAAQADGAFGSADLPRGRSAPSATYSPPSARSYRTSRSMVAVLGRRAGVLSRSLPRGAEGVRHVPGPQPVAVSAHLTTTGPGAARVSGCQALAKQQRYPWP